MATSLGIIKKWLQWVYYLLCVVFAFPCFAQPALPPAEAAIIPLPETLHLNSDKVRLGEKLFYDTRLSTTHLSCNSCHQLDHGGDSGRATDISHGYFSFAINTPSIFNARYNFRQNWDGSAPSLKEQLKKIFNNRAPMNTDIWGVINRLKQDTSLNKEFIQVYKKGLNAKNLLDSLVEFEKSLVTPDSRFDKYLRGDQSSLSKEEIQGYQLFKKTGCITCHQGINIGGNLFEKFGIFYNYLAQRGHITNADYGRINITGRKMDKYVFKVPSLRNIAVTAPYLHDGSAKTLEEAIYIIGRTQLGRNLNSNQVQKLKAFLLSLTGKYKHRVLRDNRP